LKIKLIVSFFTFLRVKIDFIKYCFQGQKLPNPIYTWKNGLR